MLINPESVPEHTGSNYPQELQQIVEGRSRKRLAKAAGLTNFGVNLVTLQPGSCSSIRHWHDKQDEFVYIIEGEITLVTDEGEQILKPGACAGFPAGEANGHHLINQSDAVARYLEIGDKTSGDLVNYPDVDLVAKDSDSGWVFTHKDGSIYDK